MTPCAWCGNTYDKAFQISIGGTTHTFDSFQCAIQSLAPRCVRCSVPIIGHGMEARGQYYCCANCARQDGVQDVVDRSADAAEAHP